MMRPGEVAWYATGRFYANEAKELFDAGYFVHLQGVAGSLFADDSIGESTAYFTFSAEPFVSKPFANGPLQLGLDRKGSFSVYLQREPRGNFDDPKSFATGECVATFERVSVVVDTTVGSSVIVNAFSARLVSSRPFTFRGGTYDFAELLPHGITQWGTASPEPITPPPQGYTTVLAFVGSAARVG